MGKLIRSNKTLVDMVENIIKSSDLYQDRNKRFYTSLDVGYGIKISAATFVGLKDNLVIEEYGDMVFFCLNLNKSFTCSFDYRVGYKEEIYSAISSGLSQGWQGNDKLKIDWNNFCRGQEIEDSSIYANMCYKCQDYMLNGLRFTCSVKDLGIRFNNKNLLPFAFIDFERGSVFFNCNKTNNSLRRNVLTYYPLNDVISNSNIYNVKRHLCLPFLLLHFEG